MTFLKNHNLKEGKQSRKNGHMTKAGWILIALMMMAATTAVVEIAGGTVGVSNQAPFVGVPILSPNPAYQGQAVSLSASVTDSNGNADITTVTAKVQNGAGYVLSQSTLSYDSDTATASGSITAPSLISNDYYVVVTATDKSGLQGSNQTQLTVQEQSTSCTPPPSSSSLSSADIPANTSTCANGGISYVGSANNASSYLASSINEGGLNISGGYSLSSRYSDNTSYLSGSVENTVDVTNNVTSNASTNQVVGYGYGVISNISTYITASSNYSSIITTNSRDVNSSYPYDPIYETDFFRTTDTRAMTWIKFTNVYASLNVTWKWYDPNNNYYTECYTTTQDPKASGYDYWSWYKVWCGVSIKNYSAANEPGNWTVNIYVDDGSGYNVAATEHFTIGYIVSEHKTAKDHQSSSPYDPINATKVFSIRDTKAESWTKFTNVSQAFTQKWEWYDPNNTLYNSSTTIASDPGQDMYYVWYKTWSSININGYDAANRPGNWSVKSYVDSKYNFSDTFTISYNIADHTMEKDHEKTSPYNPINRTTTFSITDEKAESWLRLGNVADSLTVKWEWYTPSGVLFSTSSFTSPDPRTQGYDYWDYNFWDWTCINGCLASDKIGQWEVKVYINDRYKYSEFFTITDDLAPSVGASHSPQNPTDQDSVSITVSANDTAGLNKVELYWNDGAWHNETWNSPSNPFSNTTNLGKFDVGKIIQYYSVANDTSGNTQQTSTYSFTILDRTQPNISVARSPIEPTDKDNVIIAINASDNGILGKVELYWNDGAWHNETWNSPSNPFSNTTNLGKFDVGK
ncbi:MAG: hypothetical protein O8C65_09550, partial [Candidatus Methanoperedens sp.]|nr:hypothetical protein [Candidatus Methanoperedens sp.]